MTPVPAPAPFPPQPQPEDDAELYDTEHERHVDFDDRPLSPQGYRDQERGVGA